MLRYLLSTFFVASSLMAADVPVEKKQDAESSKTANIQKILDATVLKTQYSDRIFEIYALNAIQESGKSIELSTLLQKFKEQLKSPEALQAFESIYNQVFTPEELKELANIFESQAFIKYTTHSNEINQAVQQVLNGIFLDIISKEGKENKNATPFKQVDVTASNFEAEVLKSTTPVIVNFYAEWCIPCQLLLIYLQEINSVYGKDVKFVKVDFDKNPDLGKKYNVTQLPTLLFIKDGKIVDKQQGLGTNAELDAKVKAILKKEGASSSTAKTEEPAPAAAATKK